jgi:hypothetical protein
VSCICDSGIGTWQYLTYHRIVGAWMGSTDARLSVMNRTSASR